jgi:hypothetical protein
VTVINKIITGLLGTKKTIMQVILIKDVDNLGGKDELVNVKNGYARNSYFQLNMQ